MAHLDLLAAVRSRAIARGLTLADVARASGMTPGNLRRLLSDGAGAPRLGTVMRLLPPLHAAIGPMAARTPGDLVGYLDAERRRRGASWAQLAGGEALGPAIVRRLHEAPEALPLDRVKRFADALQIELVLVDEDAAVAGERDGVARGGRAAARRPVGGGERGGPTRRAGASARAGRDEAAATVEPAGRHPSEPAPATGASSPSSASRTFRPPRLGRYRDPARGPSERGTPEGAVFERRGEARRAGAEEARASGEDTSEREILRASPRSIMASLRTGAHDLFSGLAGLSEDEWLIVYVLYYMTVVHKTLDGHHVLTVRTPGGKDFVAMDPRLGHRSSPARGRRGAEGGGSQGSLHGREVTRDVVPLGLWMAGWQGGVRPNGGTLPARLQRPARPADGQAQTSP